MILRVSVGIAYFPFFLPADFLADVFFALLAAAFGLADLPAALAAFRAALCELEVLVAAFAVLRSAFSAPRDLVCALGLAARGFSSTAASSYPSALDSTSTTSDQRMCYVETSEYGITC